MEQTKQFLEKEVFLSRDLFHLIELNTILLWFFAREGIFILQKVSDMKFNRGPVFFSILLIMFLVASFFYPKLDDGEKESVLMRAVLGHLTQLHYDPQPINDKFSEKLFDLYLDRIDWGKRYMTQEDIDKLEMYRYDLDNEAQEGNYEFFDLSYEMLNANLEKTENFYKEILAQPFDFNKEETIEFDSEKRDFEKDDAALKDYWRRYLKYQTLIRLVDKLEAQEKVGEETEIKSFEDLEKESREDVLEVFNTTYERMKKTKRSERLSFYLGTIAQIFDPHSDYLAPLDREEFNLRFYGRLEGIGARLTEEGDYVKIHEVVVGGPAWKGEELEEGDFILKVGQGSEDPVDIVGWRTTDAVQLIRGKKGTEVRLTVRKIDGTVKEISIIRDVIIFDETFAKSLILDGVEEGERVGYIYLPRFYEDFEDENGRFCSKDVAKEIEKLEEEGVDGIVLDLRNNPGGGLREAFKLSGLFIDEGPIVQVKARQRDAIVYDDPDPRVQYDGPLTVMVNHGSASASEILAGAMQDYGRAVIVGSKSTFGKGTVQNLLALDRYTRGYDEFKPLGDIRLTVQKFYRITGGSNQLKGVIPDIVLPDPYLFIETGEKDELYPLEWSEIKPVKGFEFKGPLTAKSIQELKEKSEKRIKDSEAFQKMIENARWIKEQRDITAYSLELETYQEFEKQRNDQSKKYRKMFDEKIISGVRNLKVDLDSFGEDEGKKARNDNWIESVSKDIQLYETLNVMHDLIAEK